MRVSEKEAAKLGLIDPSAAPKPDPATEERAKRLALETINRHRRPVITSGGGTAIIAIFTFIAGWVFGFLTALMMQGYRLMR